MSPTASAFSPGSVAFAPSVEKQFPHLRPYVDVSDVGKAAKDWPGLNFLIYHSGYRQVGGDFGGNAAEAWAQVEKTGRNEWVSDLAEVPAAGNGQVDAGSSPA